jgi:4-amino-4-deoxy-L-arabinose transferase-like glycosyltransferase
MMRFPSVRQTLVGVLIPLLLAAGLRLGVWTVYKDSLHVVFTQDTYGYWKPGINLFRFGAFSDEDAPPYTPNLFRTPLYPAFLGACSLALAPDLDSVGRMLDHREVTDVALTRLCGRITLVQIMLSLLALIWAWRIAWSLGGAFPAFVAAFLLALDIPSAILMNTVMSETVFYCVLIGVLAAAKSLIDHREKGAIARTALLGGLLGVLTLCRPVAMFAFVFVAPFAWFALFPRKRRALAMIVFLLASLLLPSLWTARNWVRTGKPVYCSIGAGNLYYYRAAWNQARLEGRSFDSVSKEFIRKSFEEYPNEAERTAFIDREARQILLSHPGLTVLQGVQGFVRMAFGISSTGLEFLAKPRGKWGGEKDMNDPGDMGVGSLYRWIFNDCPAWVAGLKVWSVAQMLLMYAGIGLVAIRLARRRHFLPSGASEGSGLFLAFCAVLIVYFFFISLGPMTDSRFRVPILPPLCMISAAGWGRWKKRARRTA